MRADSFSEVDSDHEESRNEHEKDFLKEYAQTMIGADFAIVFIDEKTFFQKKMI